MRIPRPSFLVLLLCAAQHFAIMTGSSCSLSITTSHHLYSQSIGDSYRMVSRIAALFYDPTVTRINGAYKHLMSFALLDNSFLIERSQQEARLIRCAICSSNISLTAVESYLFDDYRMASAVYTLSSTLCLRSCSKSLLGMRNTTITFSSRIQETYPTSKKISRSA